MEESQAVVEQVQSSGGTSEQTPEVGFPLSQPKPQKKANKWLFILLGLIVLGIAGVLILGKGDTSSNIQPEETPFISESNLDGIENGLTTTPTPESTPSDRTKVSITVKNGTGISGEAAFLQTQLKDLGYSDIKVGNADSQDNTTASVTFSSDLESSVVTELTTKLKTIYSSVSFTNSASATVDVEIVTGLRVGQTAKPASTAVPTTTATATPTPTATP